MMLLIMEKVEARGEGKKNWRVKVQFYHYTHL